MKKLQGIIDQYWIPPKAFIFSENFSHNPPWTVGTGDYSVERHGGLYSSVANRKTTPDKEHGSAHTLHFTRAANGDKSVLVDGRQIDQADDLTYADDCSIITIINNDGSYSYDAIEL